MAFTLKQKLHAWWEGYDLDALEAARARSQVADRDDDVSEEEPVVDPNVMEPDWIAFLQMLWGTGHMRPGTRDYYLNDSKVMLLTDSTTVIELGAGLGAYGRVIGEANICYVDCYEAHDLTVETSEKCPASAEERKFTSYSLLPDGELPSDRKYNRVLSNRFLHRMENPLGTLQNIKALLKDDGSILLNEYTAGAKGLLDEETQAIMDGFAAPHALISRDVYVTALEEMGFEVRTIENRSAEHLAHIAAGWLQMDQRVSDEDAKFDIAKYGRFIAQETNRWAAMSKALKESRLEYSRIFALRK
ncbi:MAG: methyltransferase domain-containing protein [Pseudomonadota bacterium]